MQNTTNPYSNRTIPQNRGDVNNISHRLCDYPHSDDAMTDKADRSWLVDNQLSSNPNVYHGGAA